MEKFITTLNSYGLLSNEEITALQNLLSNSKKLTLKKELVFMAI